MTNAEKHVLITGANGFVCSNIVDVLLNKGWHVTALDLKFDNPAVKAWLNRPVTFIEGTLDDGTFDRLPDFAYYALIHGAAITASPEEMGHTPEENFRMNIEPMLKILEFAHKNNIKRTILISSTGIFRSFTKPVMTEDEYPSPIGIYAVAKMTMEHFAETLRTVYRRDVVAVRLGNVYGLHEYSRPSRPRVSIIGRMVHEALQHKTITLNKQEQPREWTFAPDIGSAFDVLLTMPALKHSLYHVTAANSVSSTTIVDTIKQLLPEIEIIVKDEELAHSSILRRSGIADNRRFVTETQFSDWTPIQEGIKQMIAFYRKGGTDA